MKLKITHSCGHAWNYDVEAGPTHSAYATWERKMKKQPCPSCTPAPVETMVRHHPMWFRFVKDVPTDVQDEFIRALRQRISVKMAKHLRAGSSNSKIARTVYVQLYADADPLSFKQLVLDNNPMIEEADVHYSFQRKGRPNASS